MKRPQILFWAALFGSSLSFGALAEDKAAHDHHAHHQGHAQHAANGAAGKGATEVPPLRILFPEDGAKVGTQLAVVFETPGKMERLTMSAPVVGTHLHIETDGISLMPGEDQLIRLGNHRYVFLFDLPVEPGGRSLRVYWSDGMHRTIDASMQTVKVVVEDADSGKK